MRLFEISVQALCLTALSLALACGPGREVEPEDDTASGVEAVSVELGEEDTETLRVLENEVRALGICSPTCLSSLNQLSRQYRGTEEVAALQELVFTMLEDWQALLELRLRESPDVRSMEKGAEVAALHHRLGHLSEAENELERLVERDSGNLELLRQLGVVRFELGDYEGARETFVSIEALLPSGAKLPPEVVGIRGLMALYEGNLEEAASLFSATLEAAPDSEAALNGMARVLAMQGKVHEAREFAGRAAANRQAALEEVRHATLMSALGTRVSEACTAHKWDACDSLIEELLSIAKPQQLPGIYRYHASVLDSAGRLEEAKRALALASGEVGSN